MKESRKERGRVVKDKGAILDTGCSIAVRRLKQIPSCNSSFPWSLDILSEAQALLELTDDHCGGYWNFVFSVLSAIQHLQSAIIILLHWMLSVGRSMLDVHLVH